MEQEPKQPASLPDNAYRELAPGEKYSPVMPASSKPKEVTVYSVVFGIVMAIVFSAAAAYLGLRVGQVFEAAIPIRRSAQRLNPIAVLRASTMAKSTLTSTGHSNGRPLDCSAYTYPTNAKGSANIVWENLTSDA